MSDPALAALLFIQFAVILACRALGWGFARLRQPLVVAETGRRSAAPIRNLELGLLNS
ncbi:MAG TPA: hypothetical protein VKE96_14900 [Vicinamibacterales bacterium]|nr:hypothetical protein [Vicinamibacterales bacterium]